MSPIRRRGFAGAGFTLIELLVAAGVAVLLAALAAQISVRVTDSWSRASGRIGSARQARAALDQIARDLSAAWFREDGHVWFAADVLTDASEGVEDLWLPALVSAFPAEAVAVPVNDGRGEIGPGAGVWLRLFTTGNDADDSLFSPAPMAVAYRIIRRPLGAGGGPAAYRLHRFSVLPAGDDGVTAGTLESGYDLTAEAYARNSLLWQGRSAALPESDRAMDYSAVLADHVIDFDVRCYVRDETQADGLRLIFPTIAGHGANALHSARRPQPARQSAGAADEFPDVVDLTLRVLTEEGARLLSASEDGRLPGLPSGDAWPRVLSHSRTYARRLEVRGLWH